jgi:hypothetical protein
VSLLWVLPASFTALLLAFSQTVAFYGGEGFHLLAVRLVNIGRRLYFDFFYPDAPLHVYCVFRAIVIAHSDAS